MKLVEILARELNEWPKDCESAIQSQKSDSRLVYFYGCGDGFDREFSERASDVYYSEVTRSQWEAERARILAESSKFTEQDKEHVADLTDIACGKRSKEDQELWDKCFLESQSMIFENAGDMEPLADIAYRVAAWVDAFMAERAKRMKG